MTYLISYDLVAKKDYKDLIDELERCGAERRLLSAWILGDQPKGHADTLWKHFRGFVDNDDRLIVVEICGYAGTALKLKI